MIRTSFAICGLAGLLLGACQTGGGPGVSAPTGQATTVLPNADAPPGAKPGSCWARDVTPAVVETVTDQVLLQPAQVTDTGQVLAPAIYKTETRQQIVRERKELWFETPCPQVMDETFVATLQRALKARKMYWGAITGQMDRPTRRAVRRYQADQGLDSGILSMAAARKLGLVAYPRPAAE